MSVSSATGLRSLTGSLVFSVDVSQSGTYTVECANNDDDTGEVRYFDDYARVIAFIADRVRAHYAALPPAPPRPNT